MNRKNFDKSSTSVVVSQLNTETTEEKISVSKPERLKDFINHEMNAQNVPGVSVVVINEGKPIFSEAIGTTGSNPIERDTLFQAASISKPVSAFGALVLIEKHQLIGLTDDIRPFLEDINKEWLEENVKPGKKITIEQILCHMSGFNVPGNGFEGYCSQPPKPREILRGRENNSNVKNESIKWTGNSELVYSGGAYTVMQILLENLWEKRFEEKSFNEIMKKEVFDKLGMKASTFDFPNPENITKYSAGHDEHGKILKDAEGKELPCGRLYPESAAAGLWTNAEELFLIASEIMNCYRGEETILKLPANLIRNEMLREHTLGRLNGLGFMVHTDKGRVLCFEHPGINEGFKSNMVVLPETRQGIIVLTNSDNGEKFAKALEAEVRKLYEWPPESEYRIVDEQTNTNQDAQKKEIINNSSSHNTNNQQDSISSPTRINKTR